MTVQYNRGESDVVGVTRQAQPQQPIVLASRGSPGHFVASDVEGASLAVRHNKAQTGERRAPAARRCPVCVAVVPCHPRSIGHDRAPSRRCPGVCMCEVVGYVCARLCSPGGMCGIPDLKGGGAG